MRGPECPPGKDAPLVETVARGTRLLNEMGLNGGPVSWLNPAPSCWSVHFQVEDCPILASNGKGTSRDACLAGALGEFFERLATNYYFADYYLDVGEEQRAFLFYPQEQWFPCRPEDPPPTHNRHGTELLGEGLRKFYDPNGQLTADDLADHSANFDRGGICALPFTNILTGGEMYLPTGILNTLYVSNGMAAGNSADEASAQALAEIIERHVKYRVIAEGISLPEVPATRLARMPGVMAIIARLRTQQVDVKVLDASLGGQFPVICVLLSDYRSGGVCAAFGASCRFDTAVERTLAELLQGRTLAMLDSFPQPSHNLAEIADPFNLESHFVNGTGLLAWRMFRDEPDYPATLWDFHGSSKEEFKQLLRLVGRYDYSVYRAEYRHCGMYACRLVVPGMSEIYPVDDLLYNNRAVAAGLRASLLLLPKMDRRELEQFIEVVENQPLNDRQLLGESVGILFADSSVWGGLTVGELKALLYLAIGRKAEALAWCDWCLDQGVLAGDRQRLIRLVRTLLMFEIEGHHPADYRLHLLSFYREEEMFNAEGAIAGSLRFPGLPFAASWTELSPSHHTLLEIYQAQHRRKACFAQMAD